MNKTPNPFALAADMAQAAVTLFAYFEALKGAGFSESQAFALVRDMVRTGAASA
jgi:hypothetical protein